MTSPSATQPLRPRRRRLALQLVILGVVALAWGGLLLSTFLKVREAGRMSSCLDNLHRLSAALLIYAEDHGGRLPPKDSWCDAALPYIKDPRVYIWYRCPSLPRAQCGYAFNEKLGGFDLRKLGNSRQTVLLFDAQGGGWNLSGGKELLDPRHEGRAYIATASGRVRAYEADGLPALTFEPAVLPGAGDRTPIPEPSP